MGETKDLVCPSCGQKLIVGIQDGDIRLKCPKCGDFGPPQVLQYVQVKCHCCQSILTGYVDTKTEYFTCTKCKGIIPAHQCTNMVIPRGESPASIKRLDKLDD